MTHDTHVLEAVEAVPWARRPPRVLLPLLVVAVVVYTFAISLMHEMAVGYATGPTLADVETPWAVATSAAQGVLLASIGLVWAAPRATTWATSCALAVLALGTAPAAPTDLWVAAAVLAAAAAGASLVALHQRAAASAWGVGRARRAPDVTPEARSYLERRRPAPLIVGALLLLAGVAGVVLTITDDRAADEFRAAATTGAGRVVALTADDLIAVVELDDGTRLDVPLPVTTPSVGDRLEVRFDPGTGRAERVDDVFDPTGALVPGAGGLLAGTVVLAGAATRRRDVHRLVEHGGPPLRLVGTWSPGQRGILLATVDGLRPFALVPHPVPAGTGHLASASWTDDDAGGGEDRDDGAPLDDDVLLAEAARPALDDDGGVRFGLPCSTWSATPVTVVGLVQDGRPAAVVGPDGDWYVGDLPVRDPAGIVDLVARLRRPATTDAARGPSDAQPDRETAPVAPPLPVGDRQAWQAGRDALDHRIKVLVRRVAAPTGAWLPYGLLVPIFFLVRGLAADLSVLRLVTYLVAATCLGAGWSHAARAQVSVGREGLLVAGHLLDTRLPWSTVRRVVAGPDALVIITTDDHRSDASVEADDGDEDGAVLCPASDDALPLLSTTRDPEVARRRIESARPPHGAGASGGRISRRPALSLLVGLAWGAAVLAGIVAA